MGALVPGIIMGYVGEAKKQRAQQEALERANAPKIDWKAIEREEREHERNEIKRLEIPALQDRILDVEEEIELLTGMLLKWDGIPNTEKELKEYHRVSKALYTKVNEKRKLSTKIEQLKRLP